MKNIPSFTYNGIHIDSRFSLRTLLDMQISYTNKAMKLTDRLDQTKAQSGSDQRWLRRRRAEGTASPVNHVVADPDP